MGIHLCPDSSHLQLAKPLFLGLFLQTLSHPVFVKEEKNQKENQQTC